MNRILSIFPVICVLFIVSAAYNICGDEPVITTKYRGICFSDEFGMNGLQNPERGLRLEAAIGTGSNDEKLFEQFHKYKQHGVKLVLAYCNLLSFAERPLSKEKLKNLQASLDRLRAGGVKVILRFSYEENMARQYGPDLATILSHIDQLTPLIRENSDVIYVLQAGMVGAWGEWHNSTKGLEKDHDALSTIVFKLLSALPSDRMTQVRVPKYKKWILKNEFHTLTTKKAHSGTPAARIGYHDDGFLAGRDDGGTWTEPPFYANPGNPEFDLMTLESPYVVVDGELFVQNQGGKVDGLNAARRLRLHHYGSLSIAHGIAEIEKLNVSPCSIDNWMRTPITKEELEKYKLPFSEVYFKDKNGDPATRTQFEYIRDHLGYRLELQEASFPRKIQDGQDFPFTVRLINRGFSVIHNPRSVYLVLVSDYGEYSFANEFKIEEARPQNWQPFLPSDENYTPLEHNISFNLKIPSYLSPGIYKVGLWMPDPSARLRYRPDYAVRLANGDIEWWTDSDGEYGVNILGLCEITKEGVDNPDLNENLIANWQVKDSDGKSLKDSSSLGHDGLLFLPNASNADEQSSCRFDGTTCFLVKDSNEFNFSGRKPFSILMWVKPLENNTSGTLFSRYNEGIKGQYYLALKNGIPILSREIAPWLIKGAKSLEGGEWSHIAAVYDGNNMMLYLNGKPCAVPIPSGPIPDVKMDLLVGASLKNSSQSNYFTGELEDIRIYAGALSGKEVSSLCKESPKPESEPPDKDIKVKDDTQQ